MTQNIQVKDLADSIRLPKKRTFLSNIFRNALLKKFKNFQNFLKKRTFVGGVGGFSSFQKNLQVFKKKVFQKKSFQKKFQKLKKKFLKKDLILQKKDRF